MSCPLSSPHEQHIASDSRAHGQTITDHDKAASIASTQSASQSPQQLWSTATAEGVDLCYMELLIHIISDETMFHLGRTEGLYHRQISFALQTGLKFPYLLYQLLAYSARHLAFLHPSRATSHLDQAFKLQTQAISLFNASISRDAVLETNCAAVLLFSSILGHHVLADTLCKRDTDGIDTFSTHFLHCIELQVGVHTVAIQAWPLLMKTELQSVLTNSASFTSREPKGLQCADLVARIESATSLCEEEKQACQDAIGFLQVGFDAIGNENVEDEAHRYQMLCSWTMLLSPKFKQFLAAKQPEALVVLAYYAVLLHHGRSLWQVGDAGVYLFGIIRQYLGSQWDDWLEKAQEQFCECV